MTTLLYGGSFNPPHRGHVAALTAARDWLSPDRILVIPGHVPPHKALAEGSPSAEERLELARMAFASLPEASVSDIELSRGGISYSVDTLEALKSAEPETEFLFLMGTDMFLSLEKWYRFERLLELCTPAVLPRETGELESIRRHAEALQRRYGVCALVISRAPLPMSSTQVREALSKRQGRDLLPEAVYAEIIRRRFYGAKPELAWLREKAYAYLKPKRIPHVAGCEETAVRLAERWGAEPDRAAEAAILHDITKKYDLEEQLRLCEEYGIMADTTERDEPQLLHAKTGAALSRSLFGIDEEIYGAIRWHTTGRPEMTRLEKIVYLADAAEPTRSYEGVEELRAAMMRDLDEAMRLGLRMSLDVVRSRGKKPHPNTSLALEWFEKQKEVLQ